MDIILIRGEENSGKTTTSAMSYFHLEKSASKTYLFDHYNNKISEVQYNDEGEILDFKAILVIKNKVVVTITAGDEVWRLLINIRFIIDFVKKELGVEVEVLICCGKSINRAGSAYVKLREIYPKSELHQVWVSRVDEVEKVEEKQKALNQIISVLDL